MADTLVLGTSALTGVGVQVSPSAQKPERAFCVGEIEPVARSWRLERRLGVLNHALGMIESNAGVDRIPTEGGMTGDQVSPSAQKPERAFCVGEIEKSKG